MTDEHLTSLVGAFEHRVAEPGEIIFQEGSTADRFLLLTAGEVVISQNGEERFRLGPIVPVGELGGLTELRRSTTATASARSELLSISTEALLHFFEAHGQVAYPFYHSFLHIVADKLVRDRRLMEEMRLNIIQTQKAMKRMREALLEGEDSPLHRVLFEELDAQIEQNRKGHYLVDAVRVLPIKVRLDDGSLRDVARLSNEWLFIANGSQPAPEKGAEWSAVLVSPGEEIPISGTIEQADGEHFTVFLDTLIDDYAGALEKLLTRLQMLDVVL
jgi:CRP-like cAMP-binding protein